MAIDLEDRIKKAEEKKKRMLARIPAKHRKIPGLVGGYEATHDMAGIDLCRATHALRQTISEQLAEESALFEESNGNRGEYLQKRRVVLEQLMPEAFALVQEAVRRLSGHSYTVMEQSFTFDIKEAYDEQLIAASVLSGGNIAEQATGEGKTLTAVFAAYLNAIDGEGVHIVTPNEYLAERDFQIMAPLYRSLGLTVGLVKKDMTPEQKREAYQCNIVYGSNDQFAFDSLFNNLANRKADRFRIPALTAIVDEVDNIFIDKGLVPHVVSDPIEGSDALYRILNKCLTDESGNLVLTKAPRLEKRLKNASGFKAEYGEGDYILEEKTGTIALTEQGLSRIEDLLKKEIGEEMFLDLQRKAQPEAELQGFEAQDPQENNAYYFPFMEEIRNIIRAHTTCKKDIDYLVVYHFLLVDPESGEVVARHYGSKKPSGIFAQLPSYDFSELGVEAIIEGKERSCKIINLTEAKLIDSFTGKVQSTRYRHGLHSAIEAKEGILVRPESVATEQISLQSYFLTQYAQLSGMSGTAKAAEDELGEIFGLDVVQIPTHRPCIRDDMGYRVYKTTEYAIKGALNSLLEAHRQGQPVLIVTTSDEMSNEIANRIRALDQETPDVDLSGIQVLNAEKTYFDQNHQAKVIAEAGKKGSIVGSTMICGRGVDIKLGGAGASAEDYEAMKNIGGLKIIGVGMMEDQRVEQQIEGRAGRQGDPGASEWYIGIDDPLFMKFAAPGTMQRKILEGSFCRQGEDEYAQGDVITGILHKMQTYVSAFHAGQRKAMYEDDRIQNTILSAFRRLKSRAIDRLEDLDESFVRDMVEVYTRSMRNNLGMSNGHHIQSYFENHAALSGVDVLAAREEYERNVANLNLSFLGKPEDDFNALDDQIRDAYDHERKVIEEGYARGLAKSINEQLTAGDVAPRFIELWGRLDDMQRAYIISETITTTSEVVSNFIGVCEQLNYPRFSAHPREEYIKDCHNVAQNMLADIAAITLDLINKHATGYYQAEQEAMDVLGSLMT